MNDFNGRKMAAATHTIDQTNYGSNTTISTRRKQSKITSAVSDTVKAMLEGNPMAVKMDRDVKFSPQALDENSGAKYQ